MSEAICGVIIGRAEPGYRFAHPGYNCYACLGADVNKLVHGIYLTDEQRLDWLRLIRSQNVGPRGIR